MQELTKMILKDIEFKETNKWTLENGAGFLAEEIKSLTLINNKIILKIWDEKFIRELEDFNLNESYELLKYQLIQEINELMQPTRDINKALSKVTKAKIDLVAVAESHQAHSIVNIFNDIDKRNMDLFR